MGEKRLIANNNFVIKSAIESKKIAFNEYRDLKIFCWNNTSISSDGSIVYSYNIEVMNKKMAVAESNFINATRYLEELLNTNKERTEE